MTESKKTPTDLRKRFGGAKPAPVVMLHSDFAGVALRDLDDGETLGLVVPFWRVVTPGSKVAQKLSCGPDHVAHLIALDLGQAG